MSAKITVLRYSWDYWTGALVSRKYEGNKLIYSPPFRKLYQPLYTTIWKSAALNTGLFPNVAN